MSRELHVVGRRRRTDERWVGLKAVWDACDKARIHPPDEVIEFFDGIYPENEWEDVCIAHCEEPYVEDENRPGILLHLDNIPEDVKQLLIFLN